MKKLTTLFLLIISFIGNAQTVTEPKNNPENWSQPYEPFRIAGNLYYVGTYDLASYLIVTNKGNILINTGLADSYPKIKANIEKLGFKYKDIKILTLTQAHFDHMGAMADIKAETGAKLYVDEAELAELKSGGKSDYELGKYGVTFKPLTPDFLLKDQGKIKLGNTTLTLLHHPGHTKGSCSFIFETKDKNRSYKEVKTEKNIRPEDLGKAFFTSNIPWIKKLFTLRNKLVAVFGLKGSDQKSKIMQQAEQSDFAIGERIEIAITTILAEYQWRRNDYITSWQQGLLRVGINYQANSDLQLRIGYAWAETFPYGEIPLNGMGRDFTEHRIYEMATATNKVGKINLSHRFMLEQRWVGRYSNANIDSEDEFPFMNRARL
ncbi:hypothetical protein FQR65_LT17858 [Abscondita terminalis]|nr:hypothetical protein FQR65_LT17858 [Abscondita terminalis]